MAVAVEVAERGLERVAIQREAERVGAVDEHAIAAIEHDHVARPELEDVRVELSGGHRGACGRHGFIEKLSLSGIETREGGGVVVE